MTVSQSKERSAVSTILSPHEAAVIRALQAETEGATLIEIAEWSDIEVAQARSAVERLKLKSALEQTNEQVVAHVTLTEFGDECATLGLPELRLLRMLNEEGPLSIRALQQREDLSPAEVGAAFGALKQAGALKLVDGIVHPVQDENDARAVTALDARQRLVKRVQTDGTLERTALTLEEQKWLLERRLRNLFRLRESKVRSYRLTERGHTLLPTALESADELVRLTPAMLQNGSWRERRFRQFNIGLPPRLVGGSRNPYRRFLDRTKQTLLALGFEEMRGSLVENEFWDMDALFMPQFHPAREIHDVYFVQSPTHGREILEPYLSNVAKAHAGSSDYDSRGWGYLFDKKRTHRLILRSQGTALSARQLIKQPNIPGKYFSMARCFRYDAVDATHAPDFIQIEGIVLSEQITLRHLLGMLQLFAYEVAQAEEVRAVPAYFPFTEPSVEMHMRHPTLGWIELGGAGIFRPEVTGPLEIDVPVIAWGLGLDRMAMTALGFNDIRHLFTNNLVNGLGDLRVY